MFSGVMNNGVSRYSENPENGKLAINFTWPKTEICITIFAVKFGHTVATCPVLP